VDELDRRLLGRMQSDFPLVPRPFARLGEELGVSEGEVLERVVALISAGLVRRIGPVLDPERVGRVGALAAMAVPQDAIEGVAATIAACPAVTHNYEREARHGACPYNLWFTLTAESPAALAESVAALERATGLPITILPVVRKFKLGVRFSFTDDAPDG